MVIPVSFLRKETGDCFIAHVNMRCPSFVHLRPSRLFGVEMVLAGLAPGDFAVLADFEAFGIGFVGFHIFS